MNTIKNNKKHSIIHTLRKIDTDKKYLKINELFIRKQDIYLLNLIEKRSLRKKINFSLPNNKIFQNTQLYAKLPNIKSSNIKTNNDINFQNSNKKISNSSSRSNLQNNFNTTKASYNISPIDNNESINLNKMNRIQRIKIFNQSKNDFKSEPKSDFNNDLFIIPSNKPNFLNLFGTAHLSDRKKNIEIIKSGESEIKNNIRTVQIDQLLNFLKNIDTNKKIIYKKKYRDVCCGTDDRNNYTVDNQQILIKKKQINKMLKGVPNVVKRYYGVTDEY